jgi:hypothetical protein
LIHLSKFRQYKGVLNLYAAFLGAIDYLKGSRYFRSKIGVSETKLSSLVNQVFLLRDIMITRHNDIAQWLGALIHFSFVWNIILG